MTAFHVPPARAPIAGDLAVPPSKSLLQRALALAVQAEGVSEILAVGEPGDDVRRFAAALSAFAGRPVPAAGTILGAWGEEGLGRSRDRLAVDLGMNATGLRVATALAGTRPPGSRTHLGGRPALLARPHAPLLRALGRLGSHARRRPSGALRVIAGPWTRHEVAVPAGVSSQFATALLLAAPRLGGLELTLVGRPVSLGYLEATLAALRAFGVPCERDGDRVRVSAATPRGARFAVEPDASSAAPWWAAAALTGGRVRVPGLRRASLQPDVALLGVLERMGARVRGIAGGEVEVEGADGPLLGAGDVDLRDSPDLAPIVGALAASARGTTRVVGASHLKHKESDRSASVVAAVRALGGDADACEDGFTVRGRALCAGVVRSEGDHRLVLAFGVLGLVVPGVEILGAEAVAKSYPGFLDALCRAASGTQATVPAPRPLESTPSPARPPSEPPA